MYLLKNGGARKGAGRKSDKVQKKYRQFRLTDEQYAAAKSLGGSPWLQGVLNLKIKNAVAAETAPQKGVLIDFKMEAALGCGSCTAQTKDCGVCSAELRREHFAPQAITKA